MAKEIDHYNVVHVVNDSRATISVCGTNWGHFRDNPRSYVIDTVGNINTVDCVECLKFELPHKYLAPR